MTRNALIESLRANGKYNSEYRLIVNKLFEIEDLIKTCRKSIKDEGLNIYSERGSRKNPAIDMLPALIREYRAYCSLLVITPKDAAKIGEGKEDNDFHDEDSET